MVLDFGGQLLSNYEKEYSDEFFSTETESGIVTTGKTIKSIQYGNVNIAGAATSDITPINAVDVNNSYVMFLGQTRDINVSASVDSTHGYVTLTSSTIVTGTRQAGESAGESLTISFMVVEFFDNIIKALESASRAGDGTITITSVDTTKTMLILRGIKSTETSTGAESFLDSIKYTLTNATTITITQEDYSDFSGEETIYFTVVEFY